MQRVTLDIGTAFHPIEDALRDGRVVTGLSVKQDVIALPDPTQTSRSNWTVYCVITGHLVTALNGTSDFWSGYHALLTG